MKWFFVALAFLIHPLWISGEEKTEVASVREEALGLLLERFGIASNASPNEIVAVTQTLWFQKNKERWNFDRRYEEMRSDLWPIFEAMGLIAEIKPKKKQYEYAFVHGALLSRVQERVAYLVALWEAGFRFNQIVFLTGARLLLDSEKQSLPYGETERDMVEWVYQESKLPKEIPVSIVNAPMKERSGIQSRPHTGDTILAWLNNKPKSGDCLAISNQPFIAYQDAVLRKWLPAGFTLETVGPSVGKSTSVAVVLDSVAKELFVRYCE